jgi:hypothetical protein
LRLALDPQIGPDPGRSLALGFPALQGPAGGARAFLALDLQESQGTRGSVD